MQNQNNNTIAIIIGAALLAAGILGAGFFHYKAKTDNRFVTVRGVDETIVKSDFVVWNIPFKTSGETMEQAIDAIEKSQKAVIEFLQTNGLKPEEVEAGMVRVTDKQANAYGQEIITKERFVGDSVVLVSTTNVDAVKTISQKTIDLAKQGVVLSGDNYFGVPKFEYRNLDSIKPKMIESATKDARSSADKFANDSGSKVGKIRNASQGYFTVEPVNGFDTQSALFQRVRVVTTVDYLLEN
jgi:uncharacterized protein